MQGVSGSAAVWPLAVKVPALEVYGEGDDTNTQDA